MGRIKIAVDSADLAVCESKRSSLSRDSEEDQVIQREDIGNSSESKRISSGLQTGCKQVAKRSSAGLQVDGVRERIERGVYSGGGGGKKSVESGDLVLLGKNTKSSSTHHTTTSYDRSGSSSEVRQFLSSHSEDQHCCVCTGSGIGYQAGDRAGRREVSTDRRNTGAEGCRTDRMDARAALRRAERFRLLNGLQKLLWREGKARGEAYPMNIHRTAKCQRVPIGGVEIQRSIEHGTAFFTGVEKCGSVWVCPTCAAKVQERRRVEIEQGVNWVYEQEGLKAVLVTLTFPHRRDQELKVLRRGFAGALRRLRSGRVWKRFRESMGMVGFIRALEVTHGRHGWHLHTHELWIVEETVNVEELRRFVVGRWEKSCRAEALVSEGQSQDFRRYSVDVVDNCRASSYLAKLNADGGHWGVDRELSSGSVKVGRPSDREGGLYGKGRTPFALLADAVGDPVSGKLPDRVAERLYMEYLWEMRGARQLLWSKGLKGLVGLQEKSDEEVVQEDEDHAELVTMLEPGEWALVVSCRARAAVLEIAEREGVAGVRRWLEGRETERRAVVGTTGEHGMLGRERSARRSGERVEVVDTG